jgi:hypothetical protein
MADTNSGAIMEAKAGLRNLFGCLDNTSIEMTKSLNSKLKK